jgi:arylsulfatase A-like enzyme
LIYNWYYDRGAVFWHFPHYANQGGTPACAIRKGDWKLIEFFEYGIELYNLKDDISEKNNLPPLHPETVEELKAALHAWLKEMNAIVPAPNPDWKPWCDADLKPLD